MSYYQSSSSDRRVGPHVVGHHNSRTTTTMEMMRMTTSISLLAATFTLFLFQRDPETNNYNANRFYQYCKNKMMQQYNNNNNNNFIFKFWNNNNNNNNTDNNDNNNKNNSDDPTTATIGSGGGSGGNENTSINSKGKLQRYPKSRQKLDLEMAAAKAEKEKENQNKIVRHKGSCHCSAVAFHITAPKSLQVEEGTGKIPYPRTLIKAKYFTLRQGAEALQTYYDAGTSTQAAHTFCGQCGVHLLYAPSPQSSYLYLNVDCLRPGSWKYIRMMNTVQEDCDENDGQNDIEEGTSNSNNEKENHQHQHHHHGDEFDKEEFKQYYTGKKTAGGCDISNIINSNNYHHQFTSPTIMTEVLGASSSSSNLNNSGYNKPLMMMDRPPIETTPRSNNKQHLQQRMESALLSAAAIAREDYQSPSATTTTTRTNRFVPPPHQQHRHYYPRTPSPVTAVDTEEVDNDDISEPTIPPDLISSTDEGESTIADYDDGSSSVRSHFTEGTARSLRFYMSKHITMNNNNTNQGEEISSGII